MQCDITLTSTSIKVINLVMSQYAYFLSPKTQYGQHLSIHIYFILLILFFFFFFFLGGGGVGGGGGGGVGGGGAI